MVQQLHFPPEIDLDTLWRHEGTAFHDTRPSAAAQRLAAELVDTARALAHPVAFLDRFDVQRAGRRALVLANGCILGGGLVTHVLGRARQVVVVACTIGAELEEAARRDFEAGEMARGYLLDSLGNVALGLLAERARAYVDHMAAEGGLEASMPISPGHADWPLSDQQVLFELVPTSETGIRLNESHLMSPLKSVTFVMGLGTGLITHADSSQCRYCALQRTCTYRRLPGDPWYETQAERDDKEAFIEPQ